jgi:hypothetical protein
MMVEAHLTRFRRMSVDGGMSVVSLAQEKDMMVKLEVHLEWVLAAALARGGLVISTDGAEILAGRE